MTTEGYGRGDSDISNASDQSAAMIDEAYRRVGYRLSRRVGGDDSSTVATVDSLGDHPLSAFHPPFSNDRIRNHAEVDYDRTAKVAKKRYSDHGKHQKLVAGSILKNLTCRVNDTYSTIIQEESQQPQAGKKRISPTDSISPHRQALSDLGLEDKAGKHQQQLEPAKGLLQAALEVGTSSGSSTSTAPISNSLPVKGKCLTQPSEPVSNDGLDNAEGNLIVHENDRITIPSSQVHTLSMGRNRFRVIGMLGQGTFAQVFKCQCLKTGDIVAVKVVKNKPAYTRQAAVEIDVFTALSDVQKENMVRLQCYFMYHHHLCLVFELLGANLYEVLKKRQFRGLPLPIVRSLLQQAMDGVKDLSQKNIVHCDLKPENILLRSEQDTDSIVHGLTQRSSSMETASRSSTEVMSSFGGTPSTDDTGRTSSEASSQVDQSLHRIKLIDFGSACFEGHTSHTYIQSRFYRSPEVLIGVPYDSAIDMWSMGCVAAELFLGLPILPGVHEHDQLGRIHEMIGPLPDRMVEQGSKSTKFYSKQLVKQAEPSVKSSTDLPPRTPSPGTGSPAPPKTTWRLKTRQEYIQSLSANEVRKKGGMAKLQKQQTNRYFKRKKLADIIMLHGQSNSSEDRESLGLFAHFLMGILDPDPLKRWTAYQASMHPFLTGRQHRRKSGTTEFSSREFDIVWTPPWDPAICRRKLLDVQRIREKQRALRRSSSSGSNPPPSVGGRSLDAVIDELSPLRREQAISPSMRRTSRPSPTMETLAFNRNGIPETLSNSQGQQISPPSSIGTSLSYQNYANVSQSLLPGSLGSLNVSDGRMPSGGPMYAGSASYSEYSTALAVDQRQALVSSLTRSGNYDSYGDAPMGQVMHGPQSYSAIHGESIQDFGYALQRPGVFPGMDLSFSGSSNVPPPQILGGVAYSPRQFPPEHQRSRSFTHSTSGGIGGSLAQLRRQSEGVSEYMINQGMASATSIKEDTNDFVLGSGSGSMETGSSATSSLLAQQLEGRSAGGRADSYQERMDVRLSQPPPTNLLGAGPSSLPAALPPAPLPAPQQAYMPTMPFPQRMPASADSGGYYYTTYVTPNGAVMSAPVNLDMQSAAAMQAYGSPYGAYAEQQAYGPPSLLHQPPEIYPQANLSKPSLEEMRHPPPSNQRRPQRAAYPPHNHQGMSM